MNVEKPSPGPRLIKGMQGILAGQYTMRTLELNLEPQEYGPEEVLRIREQLRASQGVFAKLLGVSIKTVQAWEQGNNPPPPMARRLLDTIGEDPVPWAEKLRKAAEECGV